MLLGQREQAKIKKRENEDETKIKPLSLTYFLR